MVTKPKAYKRLIIFSAKIWLFKTTTPSKRPSNIFAGKAVMLSATNLRHNFCFSLKEYSPLGYLLTGSTTVVCVLLICKIKISLCKFKIKTSFQGFFQLSQRKQYTLKQKLSLHIIVKSTMMV